MIMPLNDDHITVQPTKPVTIRTLVHVFVLMYRHRNLLMYPCEGKMTLPMDAQLPITF